MNVTGESKPSSQHHQKCSVVRNDDHSRGSQAGLSQAHLGDLLPHSGLQPLRLQFLLAADRQLGLRAAHLEMPSCLRFLSHMPSALEETFILPQIQAEKHRPQLAKSRDAQLWKSNDFHLLVFSTRKTIMAVRKQVQEGTA